MLPCVHTDVSRDDPLSENIAKHWKSNEAEAVLSSRSENVSNFVKVDSLFGADARFVYKTYATLHVLFIFDSSENELAMLDLMQVFVETMDKCFSNARELDIVFNFNKVHAILDEIILGGQVLETSSSEVVKAVEEISKMERAANSIWEFLQ